MNALMKKVFYKLILIRAIFKFFGKSEVLLIATGHRNASVVLKRS